MTPPLSRLLGSGSSLLELLVREVRGLLLHLCFRRPCARRHGVQCPSRANSGRSCYRLENELGRSDDDSDLSETFGGIDYDPSVYPP